MWVEIILAVIGLCVSLYLYITRKYNYFKDRGIPFLIPSFPYGSSNVKDLLLGNISVVDISNEIYWNFPNDKVVGQFQVSEPQVVIRDLDIAKNILVKDFDHFTDRRKVPTEGKSQLNKVFSKMLISLSGEQWKTMRTIVSPIFTSGKLKAMTVLVNKVGEDFVEHLSKISERGEPFNAKDTFTNFTVDSIASCGFGFEARSLNNPESQFRSMITKLTDVNQVVQFIQFAAVSLFPSVARMLDFEFEIFNKEAGTFVLDVLRQSIANRKSSKIRRNDLLDLLMDALEADRQGIKQELEKDQYDMDATLHMTRKKNIPDEDIEMFLLSNAFILFFAGFDTSSTIMSIAAFFLATHQDVQDKLYDEISEAVAQNDNNESLDYNTIQSLPYLDKVVHETLRLYPITIIERLCVKDYLIPGTNFVVPKDMLVQIPSTAIMKDPQHYNNADKFDPENFSTEAKAKRNPYAFLASGQGPRNCVGMRFALLQVKTSIIRLVANFRVDRCAKTPTELIPDPKSITIQPKGELLLAISPRK
uniref:Cytochrome P450 CYP3025A3 n=1 Tax=Tigriopus japonicus TaxID=158387 RepID=A0A088DHY6_TIGJA|nr:cytochrome P450 CYP3025A3 [Tigriopus japonicus]